MTTTDRPNGGRSGVGRASIVLGMILPRLLAVPLVAAVAGLTLAIGVAFGFLRREYPAAPDYRVVQAGGLEYEAMLGRPLNPANRIDARILAGLPARDRRLRGGDTLYGAFIAVTNASPRPRRSAEQIELRDERGHVYRPIRLPASNAYAYTPRLVHSRTRIPRFGTRADDNLAATGRLVLFRVPKWQYRNGRFELRIDGVSLMI
jgi:hypothetical protein